MDKEYGVSLQLELSDFKEQINNIQSMIKDIKEQQIDLNIDTDFDTTDIKTSLDQIEQQVQTLKNSTEGVGKEIGDNLAEGIEESGEKTVSLMQQLKSYLKNMSPDTKMKLAFLGVSAVLLKIIDRQKEIKARNEKLKQGFKELGKNIVKTTASGIAGLKRFALSLFGIQSAFRAVSKAIHSYMQYDQELSKSIQTTWAGLGSFFAPILEYLTSAFRTLLAYVNQLVLALTGINFVARANAKALANTSKSIGGVGKALKSLGGFDEINNINQDTGTGDTGSSGVEPIELPEVDTSKFEKIFVVLEKLKKFLGTMFEPIQTAWQLTGGALIESATKLFGDLKLLAIDVGKSIYEVWTNGTGEQTMVLLISLATTLLNIIDNIVKAIDNAWTHAETGTKIIQDIANIFNDILKFVNEIAKTIEEWTLSPEFQEMINTLLEIIEKILARVHEILDWFVKQYDKYIKPVVKELLGLISDIIILIGEILKVAKPVIDQMVSLFKQRFGGAISAVTTLLSGIISVIRGIIQIITGALQGNWDKVWNGMKNVAKGVINVIIGALNVLINGLNKITTPLRAVIIGVGNVMGKKWTFDTIKIPQIPRLKVGTDDVYSEGIAYLHKGEKVVPADVAKGGYTGSDNEETNELLRQLITTLEDKDFNPYIKVDDIGKASVDYINKKKRITGEAIV